MRDTLEMQGKTWANEYGLRERYGISVRTFARWKSVGVTGASCLIGRTRYYDVAVIDENLIADKAGADMSSTVLYTSRVTEADPVPLAAMPDGE